MKKKQTIILMFCMLLVGSITAREKVNKNRDKLRFGYGDVSSVKIYEMGNDGELYHVSTDVFCKLKGGMGCSANTTVNTDPTYELDIFEGEYTLAERIAGENVLVSGDTQIEDAGPSGTVSQTIHFFNSGTGESYYRTFSYVWITNADSSINSSLDVSAKF